MTSRDSDTSYHAAVVEAVRGEMSWRDLERFGITVRVTEAGVKELGGRGEPVRVSAEDIAWGWLRTSTNKAGFREWARFVFGAVGTVELQVEGHPLGEEILQALWDAAFGEPVTDEMTTVMRRVLAASS